MTILCERCGAEAPASVKLRSQRGLPDTVLCPDCAKRAGVGQGDGQAVLTAARGCRDMLRESAKQFRLLGDQGHAKMADIHAEQACAAIPQLEALLAERAEMVEVLRGLQGVYGVTAYDNVKLRQARALLAKLPEGAS